MLAVAVSACNVTQTQIEMPVSPAGVSSNGQPFTATQIDDAIRIAVKELGWTFISVDPGLVVARVDSGGHYAVVDIHHDDKGWSIRHRDSDEGLHFEDREGGAIIHRRYNMWVRRLDDRIRSSLGKTRDPAI